MFEFGKKNRNKIILTLVVFGAVFLVGANIAFAQSATSTGGYTGPGTAIGSVSNQPIASNLTGGQGKEVLESPTGIAGFIFTLTGALMSLFGYLIDFAVLIGKDLINLPIVQIGSQVMINFANLGFVFAIIVIAFATIFRVQGYQMKQILWKLIVAAILINFSLTIAGAFISVSNIFTDFFLKSFEGGSLSRGLMGILNPQKLLKVENVSGWDMVSNAISFVFQFLTSILFLIVFNLIIILTFMALFIMLLIRTIMLGLLLVLMPIIWLLWIFPGTSKYWNEWWSSFIRWTFFAPIVLFFLALVASTGNQMQNIRGLDGAAGREAAEALGKTMTLNTGFLDHVTQIIITVGLLLGGLIASNKLGITFSSTAMGLAKGGGKMFGGWVGRKTTEKTAGRLLGSEKVKEWTTKLSGGGTLSRLAGTGLNRLSGTVEKYTKKPHEDFAKGLSDDRLNNEILASKGILGRGAKRAALLAEAAKRKEIRKDVQEQLFYDPKSMEQIQKEFKTAGLNFGAVEKGLGYSLDMMKAETDDQMQTATKSFIDKLATKDWSKGQWDNLFERSDSKAEIIKESLALNIAMNRNEAYAKIAPTLKGKNLEGFKKTMEKGIDRVVDKETAKKAGERLDKTLDRRASFGDEGAPPAAAATA